MKMPAFFAFGAKSSDMTFVDKPKETRKNIAKKNPTGSVYILTQVNVVLIVIQEMKIKTPYDGVLTLIEVAYDDE